MNESVRLSPCLDWLLLSTRQQPNIQPRGPCVQDDFPNDDARLLVPRALWVEGCRFSAKPPPPESQTTSQTSVTEQRQESVGKWMLAVEENRLWKLISEFPAARRAPQTSQSSSINPSLLFLTSGRTQNASRTPLDGTSDAMTKAESENVS